MNSVEYGLLLKSHTPERAKELLSQRYSIFGDQKPILVLHEQPGPVGEPSRRKRKSRANQALQEFRASGSRDYATYLPLASLWKSYMDDVLGDAGQRDPVACTGKILTADWNGAVVRVTAAKNPSLVGQQGIVLWEGKSFFLVVTKANKFKEFPKRGTVFELDVDPPVQLVGSRLCVRSSERTTRKFKPHSAVDICDYVDL